MKDMQKNNSEFKVELPIGFFEERCCANCGWSEEDPTANWKWYCNYKRTHVRATDYCGYYK